MSTAVLVPPPNSSSVVRTAPRLTERARALLTAMNLHFAAVAAMIVLTLWLLVHLFLVLGALKARDADAMADQRAKLRAAEISTLPVKGLDAKVAKSTQDADDFYADRLPYATSQVLVELGALTKKANVRLSRVAYVYAPQLAGNGGLTEVRVDASISGDYRPTVQFINSLERDHMFFLINGLNLSGQQTGQVNLRLRMTTYLREPRGNEATHGFSVPDTDPTTAVPAEGVGQ